MKALLECQLGLRVRGGLHDDAVAFLAAAESFIPALTMNESLRMIRSVLRG